MRTTGSSRGSGPHPHAPRISLFPWASQYPAEFCSFPHSTVLSSLSGGNAPGTNKAGAQEAVQTRSAQCIGKGSWMGCRGLLEPGLHPSLWGLRQEERSLEQGWLGTGTVPLQVLARKGKGNLGLAAGRWVLRGLGSYSQWQAGS